MSQNQTIRTRAEMTPKYFDTISRMIRSQAYRELAAATTFAGALRFVPTLAFKRKVVQHVQEEMEHYAICVDLYREIGAGDLDEICTKHLQEERPIPDIESFLELGVAQFLYDRASAFQLREYENSTFDPYCRVVGRILEEEEGHESFGEEILIRHCRATADREQAQRLFDKWFVVSMRSFGRPGTPGSRYAISVGLKTRDSGAVAQDYVDTLKSTMRVCGLVLPSRGQLKEAGIDTAPGIDLTL